MANNDMHTQATTYSLGIGVPPQYDDPYYATVPVATSWHDEELESYYAEFCGDDLDEQDVCDEAECQAIACPFDSAFSELSDDEQADALLSCRLLFGPARRRIDLEGLAGTGLFSVHRI